MKKTRRFLMIILCLNLIIANKTNFNIFSKLSLGINSILLLIAVLISFLGRNRNENR